MAVSVLGLLGLAACSSNSSSNGFAALGNAAVSALSDTVTRSNVLGAEAISSTDAQLRAYPRPLLKVTQLKIGLDAALTLTSEKGAAVTWTSADNKSLTVFNGLLIQTRGLGNDLMSAKVPSVNSGKGEVLREHYYQQGNERIGLQRFFCELATLGTEQTTVVGVGFSARVITETCANDDYNFENRYWFAPDAGLLKSIQWGGPEIGSLMIEYVPRTGGTSARVASSARPEAQPQVFILE